MVEHIHKLARARCKLTHKHYGYIVTGSSGLCAIVHFIAPQYNSIGVILAALTNVVWVWGDHNV